MSSLCTIFPANFYISVTGAIELSAENWSRDVSDSTPLNNSAAYIYRAGILSWRFCASEGSELQETEHHYKTVIIFLRKGLASYSLSVDLNFNYNRQ